MPGAKYASYATDGASWPDGFEKRAEGEALAEEKKAKVTKAWTAGLMNLDDSL